MSEHQAGVRQPYGSRDVPLQQEPINFYLLVAAPPGVPLNVDVIDRAARLLGIIYGNQGQIQQRAVTLEQTVHDDADKSTTTMHNVVNLNIDDNDFVSAELNCLAARKFLLMYDLTEFGALVNLDRVRFRVEFREAGGTWRTYVNGPFGALYEEESTTPCNLCVSGDCIGEYMRIVARTDYTNANPAANYFILTSKVTLMI